MCCGTLLTWLIIVQTVYVTLDLSSLASGIRPKDQAVTESKSIQESSPITLEQQSFVSSNEHASEQPPATRSSEQIQILGLSSSNPIISYRKQLYSCQWTAPLGTDIILKPSAPHSNDQTLLSERKRNPVLAISNLRLTAQPVRPNTFFKGNNEEEQDHQPQSNISTPAEDPELTEVQNPQASSDIIPRMSGPQGVYIQGTFVPISDQATPKRKNQARFLHRLEAAKRARGESDKITVHAMKPLTGAGWRTQRKELEAESEEDDVSPDRNEEPRDSAGEAGAADSVTPKLSPARPLIGEAPRPGYSKYGRKIGRPKSLKKQVHDIELRDTIRAAGLFGEYRPQARKKRVPGKGTRGRRRGRVDEDIDVRGEDVIGGVGRDQEQEEGRVLNEEGSGEVTAWHQQPSEDLTMENT